MSFHQSAGGDVWVQWFKCCVSPQVPHQKRRRIDRSMIGEPTNFVHLGHVGANDMHQGSRCLSQLQSQMCSKGQYQGTGPVRVSS